MSGIYVDEVIPSGLTQVNFPQGIKIAETKSIDLSGAALRLTSGIGIDGQVLTSTGTGLVWSTRDNTDTTYTFAGRGLALNDVKIDLIAGGSGSGTQTITFAGATRESGEICWDASYLYICVATNTWKRIPLTW